MTTKNELQRDIEHIDELTRKLAKTINPLAQLPIAKELLFCQQRVNKRVFALLGV